MLPAIEIPTRVKPLVLYADDDPQEILRMHRAIQELQFSVELVTVRDGYDVVKFLENIPVGGRLPCLVLLDINMPGMNGRDTLIRLRSSKKFAAIPVILFPTSSMELPPGFARKYQAGFMIKPLRSYQVEALIDKVAQLHADA